MTARLDLSDLTYQYPHATSAALSGVDLQIPPSQMMAVLGPSGSGKSTLLRAVAGLIGPNRGRVHVDGRDLSAVPPERRGIAMMFQRPLLFPHLSVVDNVAYPYRLRGISRTDARAAAHRMLELVHLSDHALRHPRQLSGGQEQRVALARALAVEPTVLLLDEPFSALDTELRSSMHDLLAQMRALLAPTVLLVTHDLAEAGMADRVAVLVDGHLVQEGPPADLYRAPANTTVARLVGGFTELPHRPQGPGTLVTPLGVTPGAPGDAVLVRQESLHVVPASQGEPAGVVQSVRWIGSRQVAVVNLDGVHGWPPVAVRAETLPGHAILVGARVGLRLAGPLIITPKHPVTTPQGPDAQAQPSSVTMATAPVKVR